MKLAIMQPYLFPYIGYFQLINAVDKFVIYDDVNFIKQGWINRNNILVQGKSFLFTLPLANPSSFSKINEVLVNDKFYDSWKGKFLKTIEQSYNKAPFFNPVYNIINEVLHKPSLNCPISELATKSFVEIYNYWGTAKEFVWSSSIYDNAGLSGKERVLDICKIEKCSHYINPIGGIELYDKNNFKENGFELSFIKSQKIEYKQFRNDFLPGMSIIDVLMFNSIEETQSLLNKYELI